MPVTLLTIRVHSVFRFMRSLLLVALRNHGGRLAGGDKAAWIKELFVREQAAGAERCDHS